MSRATAASTDGLIANLYESIFNPSMLDDFLQELAVRTESRAVHLLVHDARTGMVLLHASGGVVGSSAEELAAINRDYDENFAGLDYRLTYVASLPLGQWCQCHEVFAPQRVKRERFFREFLQKYDYRYFAGMKMGEGGGQIGCALGPVVVRHQAERPGHLLGVGADRHVALLAPVDVGRHGHVPQLGHALAHRGLADAEPIGRGREAALLGQHREPVQMAPELFDFLLFHGLIVQYIKQYVQSGGLGSRAGDFYTVPYHNRRHP